MLRSGVRQIGLPEIVIKTFPLDSIVEAALINSSYWANLAEEWINLGYPLNDHIAKIIPNNEMVIQWQKQRIEKIFGEKKTMLD